MLFSKSKLSALWLFPLYFLYIFNISFVPLPYYLRTRLILGTLGMIVAVLLIRPSQLSKSIIFFLLALFFLLVPSAITMIANRTVDLYFVQYTAQQVFHMFGAYLLVILSLRYVCRFDLDRLFLFIVYALVINNLLAVIMFFVPPLQGFMLSIQNHDEVALLKLEEYVGMSFRFYGLGVHTFFMGGLLSGYSLLLLAFVMRREQRRLRTIWLSILFVFIAVTGLFIARTTLVGAAMGTLYILWPSSMRGVFSIGRLKRTSLFFLTLASWLALGILVLNLAFPDAWDTSVVMHALELFVRLDQGSGLATSSTDDLLTMYTWPESWSTWLFGDGLFNMPGGGFYMDTDVGYLRMIYYFGVFGMISFFVAQFVLLDRIQHFYDGRGEVKLLLAATAIYVLLLNLKALTDVNAFLYLMLWTAVLGTDSLAEDEAGLVS